VSGRSGVLCGTTHGAPGTMESEKAGEEGWCGLSRMTGGSFTELLRLLLFFGGERRLGFSSMVFGRSAVHSSGNYEQ